MAGTIVSRLIASISNGVRLFQSFQLPDTIYVSFPCLGIGAPHGIQCGQGKQFGIGTGSGIGSSPSKDLSLHSCCSNTLFLLSKIPYHTFSQTLLQTHVCHPQKDCFSESDRTHSFRVSQAICSHRPSLPIDLALGEHRDGIAIQTTSRIVVGHIPTK